MTETRLTVVIPTFDRPVALRANLSVLLPQLTPACRLLILDNHSPVPVRESVGDLLAAHPGVACEIVRHRINIGGDANAMRCFELCNTEWMWPLGDDDLPAPAAVAAILAVTLRHPQAAAINFSTADYGRDAEFETVGGTGFVDGFDSFENVGIMASTVYRVAAFEHAVRVGYSHANTMATHLVTLLAGLGKDGRVAFVPEQVLQPARPVEMGQRWSPIKSAVGLLTLHDHDFPGLTDAARVRLSERVRAAMHGWRSMVLMILAQVSRGDITPLRGRYLIDQLCGRYLWYTSRPLSRWAAVTVVRLMARMPRLSWAVLRLAARAGGRGKGFDYFRELAGVGYTQRV